MAVDLYEFAQELFRLAQTRTPVVMVTLTKIRGSAPQIVGAKALVTADGIVAGTVGGGKLEGAAATHAKKMLLDDAADVCQLLTWNLQTDIGMTCGGEVQLLFEILGRSTWSITVFGAGHVAQAVVRLLLTLNCRLTCIDSRSNWLDRLPEHRRLTKVCAENLTDLVRDQPADTFFVLMSQGHATDLPVLAEILQTRTAPYIGVIGSSQKAAILKRGLAELGIEDAKLESFHCPLGLPIGNNTPVEIAISVAGQLLEQRDRWLNLIG